MNTPFTLELQVIESNYDSSIPILGIERYPIRVTLRHKLNDVIQLIWYNSDNFNLKPVFFKITDSEGKSLPDESFYQLLNTEVPPLSPYNEFQLRIDYTLFNNRNIPNRDPQEELFDVAIEWNDSSGRTNTINIRESLHCTVGTLKEYVADERNKSLTEEEPVDGSYFHLRYWADDDICIDDTKKISEIIQLDVPPLSPVLFELLYNLDAIARSVAIEPEVVQPPNIRFFIKISSDVSNLQEEASLFEVNHNTTLRDFINVIIERADAYQVRRTFFNQVKLYYDDTMIAREENYDLRLYDILNLDESILATARNVVTLKLLIHEHLSGVEGGILSRQFLNDLTSQSRFEFSPTTNDDLNNLHADVLNGSNETHEEMLPFEPTRIVIQDGTEWNLSGDTYELLETNSMSIGPSQPTRQAFVNQGDIASMDYIFSFLVDGQNTPVEVSLNTSQCFIVDNELHQPYVALSPSGAAKLERTLNRAAGRPVFQQVRIQVYDDPALSFIREPSIGGTYQSSNGHGTPRSTDLNNQHTNRDTSRNDAPGNDPLGNEAQQFNYNVAPLQVNQNRFRLIRTLIASIWHFVSHYRNWFYLILKLAILLFALDILEVVLTFWKRLLIISGLAVSIYSLIFRTGRVATGLKDMLLTERNIQRFGAVYQRSLENICDSMIRFEDKRSRFITSAEVRLVKYTITRPRQYEYEIAKINKEDGFLYRLRIVLSNCAKDIILFWITFIPSVLPLFHNELEKFRSSELQDLRGDILRLYDMYIQQRTESGQSANEFDINAINNFPRHNTALPNNPEDSINGSDQQDITESNEENFEYGEEYEFLLSQYMRLQMLYNLNQ